MYLDKLSRNLPLWAWTKKTVHRVKMQWHSGNEKVLLPPVSIVHRYREVFQATSCIDSELLYIGSSWSSYLCLSIYLKTRRMDHFMRIKLTQFSNNYATRGVNQAMLCYRFGWFGFIEHQPLYVINPKSIFININITISNNSV